MRDAYAGGRKSTPHIGQNIGHWKRMLAYVTGSVDEELLAIRTRERRGGLLTFYREAA
jgi:hypothetical protein